MDVAGVPLSSVIPVPVLVSVGIYFASQSARFCPDGQRSGENTHIKAGCVVRNREGGGAVLYSYSPFLRKFYRTCE